MCNSVHLSSTHFITIDVINVEKLCLVSCFFPFEYFSLAIVFNPRCHSFVFLFDADIYTAVKFNSPRQNSQKSVNYICNCFSARRGEVFQFPHHSHSHQSQNHSQFSFQGKDKYLPPIKLSHNKYLEFTN